jgi:hypothetical protein
MKQGQTWYVSGSTQEPRNHPRLNILSIESGRSGRTEFCDDI